MTPFTDMPPLLTDDDAFARVRDLVGPAAIDGQLWLMFVDGDDRQAPVVMPIEPLPPEPDPKMMNGLGEVLGGFIGDLATDGGPGSVIVTYERLGPLDVTARDVAWADAVRRTCRAAGVRLRGMFLTTRGGVLRM